jgi:exodeoxyribonuclease-5
MNWTNDQYYGMTKLTKWWRKYQNQFIEISGVIGTGIWDLVQEFIQYIDLDVREVMYLSYDQKQVLDLAFKKFHSYYINGIIYNYTKIVDFSTLPAVNPLSKEVQFEWKKELRSKIDNRYKLIVIFDSLLLNYNILRDIATFGVPIILIRDPMLLPAPDTHVFLRDANIELREANPIYIKNPITYFAHKVLNEERMNAGNYDTVSVVTRKQMNLYNLKSSDINITISENIRNEVNHIYRERIMNRKDIITVTDEKVIVMESLYNHKLVNKEEKKIKIYLTRGVVGRISKINKHPESRRWVSCEFKPEFYHEAFTDLVIDRHYLNNVQGQSQQMIPDETIKVQYAYALTADLSRLSHWDKVTLIVDNNEEHDSELQKRMIYTAITRAKKSLTIVI